MKKKKILVLVIVSALSLVVFLHWGEALRWLANFEKGSRMMPVVTGALFILLKTVAAPLGIPGAPLTLLSGALFGNGWGTLVALVGNTIGAALAFLLSRYVFKEYVQKKFMTMHLRMQAYERRLEREALPTVIALRLIPLFPFNALNFLFGVTNVRFGTYVLGSFIGMIPGTFAFVYFGESLRMFSAVKILFSVLGILGLAYIGHQYARRGNNSSDMRIGDGAVCKKIAP